jgi:putative ABC transport system substrate-binding protein
MRRREFIAGLGGVVALPAILRAQQAALPVVGFLDLRSPRLAAAGFVEGQTVAIEYRWANNQGARLAPLAAELVQRQVAVIVALGGPPVLAAKAATSTIPIVFGIGADPIEFGLVASLSRPGGNMTGVTGLSGELTGKRLDLLRQMAPLAMTVAYLTDPGARDSEEATRQMLATARALGRQAIILEARSEFDIDAAFATLIERGAGALVVGPHILFERNGKKIIDLAARYKIPAIYPGGGFAVAGGLMSYTADGIAAIRQIGSLYTAQILRGAKPSDLPVQQPTKFNLVVNLSTARALGIEVPETLLATADELIENEPRLGLNLVPTLGWNLVPMITVVSGAGDPRLQLANDAIAFWNDTLAALGTPFRLGALTQVVGSIPVEDLVMISPLVTDLPGLPESLKRIEGNIVVALSDREFISFTARRPALNKAVVAIKDYHSFPLTLPNVARNLIAHELGHAIGLRHNSDPTTLMCGRPAQCRPDLFRSDQPRMFPLTDDEKRQLLMMYPPQWKTQSQ